MQVVIRVAPRVHPSGQPAFTVAVTTWREPFDHTVLVVPLVVGVDEGGGPVHLVFGTPADAEPARPARVVAAPDGGSGDVGQVFRFSLIRLQQAPWRVRLAGQVSHDERVRGACLALKERLQLRVVHALHVLLARVQAVGQVVHGRRVLNELEVGRVQAEEAVRYLPAVEDVLLDRDKRRGGVARANFQLGAVKQQAADAHGSAPSVGTPRLPVTAINVKNTSVSTRTSNVPIRNNHK